MQRAWSSGDLAPGRLKRERRLTVGSTVISATYRIPRLPLPHLPPRCRTSYDLPRNDSFSTSWLNSAQCLDLLVYKLYTDINFRTWQHSERNKDVRVNCDAAEVFRVRWPEWKLTDTDARMLVDFVMRRVTYQRDLDELISQLNKYFSSPSSHYPISFIEAATASFANQRATRFGKLPGPSYRCDACSGPHLKERCPKLTSSRAEAEIIGVALFRCDRCKREWRSDSTGLSDSSRSCMCCKQPGRRVWFVETCSSACDPHCPRLAHATRSIATRPPTPTVAESLVSSVPRFHFATEPIYPNLWSTLNLDITPEQRILWNEIAKIWND